MGAYFLDTSAILKCYVPERGHDIYISQITLVEVVTSICRKAHEKIFTPAERDTLIDVFRADSDDVYGVRLLTPAMCTAAGNLCRVHRLRAYDAMQLACALDLRDEIKAEQVPGPVFVCADNNLLNVAKAEGLMVENPNNYS